MAGMLVFSFVIVFLVRTSFAIKPSHMACEGCHGVVTEIHERLAKPASGDYSARVPRVLGKICNLESLVKYIYSPPKMVRACEELLKSHRPKIEESLIEQFKSNPKVTAAELEEAICFKIAGSCEGIKKSPEEDLRQSVKADHVLQPGVDQKITFEQDGEKIVPKTTNADETSNEAKKTRPPPPKRPDVIENNKDGDQKRVKSKESTKTEL